MGESKRRQKQDPNYGKRPKFPPLEDFGYTVGRKLQSSNSTVMTVGSHYGKGAFITNGLNTNNLNKKYGCYPFFSDVYGLKNVVVEIPEHLSDEDATVLLGEIINEERYVILSNDSFKPPFYINSKTRIQPLIPSIAKDEVICSEAINETDEAYFRQGIAPVNLL